MKKTFLKLLLFISCLFLGMNFVFAEGPAVMKKLVTNISDLNVKSGIASEYPDEAGGIVLIKFVNTDEENFVVPDGVEANDLSSSSTATNKVLAYLVDGNESGTYELYITFSEGLMLNANSSGLFRGLEELLRIDGLEYVNTSSVTKMGSMFQNCKKLSSLDLSHFDTSLVTDMSSMFDNCTSISTLNVSSFTTSNVTNMLKMFYHVESVKSLDLSSFTASSNLAGSTALLQMFEGCSSLESINFGNFNPSKITYYTSMFASCTSLKSVDLRKFTFESAIANNAGQLTKMFQNCSSLETIYVNGDIDLSNLVVSGTRNRGVFEGCTSLVGGKGTAYADVYETDAQNSDTTVYAKPDGGSENPGYFSAKTNARDFVITYPMDNEYTGSAVTPTVVVKDGDTTLTEGTDYTLSFDNNIAVGEGTAHFKLTAKGEYNGEVDKYFNIVRANIENATSSEIPNQLFTGDEIFPTFTLTLYNRTLVKGTDYEVEYNRNQVVGEAQIIVSGIGNYTGEKIITFNIVGPDVSNATVSSIANQIYTGSELRPEPTVTFGDKTLIYHDDYRLEYTNNINIGVATVRVVGIGNYSGTKEVTFKIIGDLKDATIADIQDQTFTGNAITPSVSVKFNGTTLVKDQDYTVSYDNNNINVGESTITIAGKGSNYTGITTKKFNIVEANISSATVVGASQEYTGKAVVTTATVTFNGKRLVEGTDYTLEFSNNINIGTANLVVKGKGNLTGTKNGTFEITKANIGNATVEEVASQKYTGSEIKPKVVAKFNNETLVEGTDYTLSYDNNIYTGNASITLIGKGRFKDTKVVTFKITGANIEDATISSIANQTFIAAPITPTVKVTYAGKELVRDRDYTVNYSNNKDVGTATVAVTGKGSFSETKTTTFKIVAASMGNATIEKIEDQLYTGKEVTPKVTVKFNGITLTEGTDYTVSYSNNIEAGAANVKVTGKNNLTGTKTATFSIKGLDLSNMKIDKIPAQVYNGNEVKPKVIVKFESTMLEEGTDYEVVYSNNIKVGTANVTAKGIGKYSGQVKSTFNIYYGITYELNGGVNNSNNKEYYDSKVNTKLYNPTKFGYKFKGWYTTDKYKTKITQIDKGSKGNKTVYAKWAAIKYKVVFNKNGGTGTTKDMTLKYNKTYKLNKNKYKKKGYKFIEWNTEKDGSGTSYKNKEEVKNLRTSDGDIITLYAQWEKKKYTITYNLNGGTLSEENKTEYYVNTKTFKLNNPKKTGYKFKGWYKNKKYTGAKVTKITKGSSGNLTLYAKFEPIKYQVIFNKNTGTGRVNDILAKYNKTYKLTKNSYKKKGYKFVGWNTEKDGSGISYTNKQKIKNLTTKNNKKITLYAQWKKKTYKITYKLDGGVNSELNPETYNIKTATIKLSKPTKEGYKFVGWYSNKAKTVKVKTIDKGSTGNKTLYAKWKKLPTETASE